MGELATDDQMVKVDALLSRRDPVESAALKSRIEANKKADFREDVEHANKIVIKWILEKKGGDSTLLEQLEIYVRELVDKEANLLLGTNNMVLWLPSGPKSNMGSYHAESRRGTKPKVRKSVYTETYTHPASGKSLDSLIGTDDRHIVSERFKTATFRSLAQDIEKGLAELGLNPRLNRLNQYRVGRTAYNPVTIPLLLWLRLNYGYTINELIG